MDGLTGLHNRRYLDSQLSTLVTHAVQRNKELALLVVDIDFFKRSTTPTAMTPATECCASSPSASARTSAASTSPAATEARVRDRDAGHRRRRRPRRRERLRQRVAGEPFPIAGGTRQLNVTISIGLASLDAVTDTPEAIIKRADTALYQASATGGTGWWPRRREGKSTWRGDC